MLNDIIIIIKFTEINKESKFIMEIIIIYPAIITPKIKVNLLINKMIKDENLENIYGNNITKIIIYNKNDKKK